MAEAVLRSKGVSFMLRSAVECVEGGHVVLASGAGVPADVVVWAAHTRSSSQAGDGWQRGIDGRIVVDPYLRAAGSERIFIAGDNALAYDYARDRPAPSNAQLAVQQGALVAQNVAAASHGRTPAEYRPRMLGEALSLGGKDGVAQVGGVVVSGRLALTAKQAALIRYLSGIGRPGLTARYV
jgi:NADH dehydrogenase